MRQENDHLCIVCGKIFPAKRDNAKCCSDSCRGKFNRNWRKYRKIKQEKIKLSELKLVDGDCDLKGKSFAPVEIRMGLYFGTWVEGTVFIDNDERQWKVYGEMTAPENIFAGGYRHQKLVSSEGKVLLGRAG